MTPVPEPAVSPASDTDALRQQVADLKAAIADIDAHATPIGLLHEDDPDGSPHHYAVTVGALHRALGKAYTAESCDAERARLRNEVAGLRADLDRARAERDSMVRDLLTALHLGPMPDRPVDTVWTTLLKIASEQEDNRHATAMAGVRDRLEVKQLRAELARSAGARTIPDDAAALVSQWLLDNVSDINGDRLPDYHASRPLAHSLLEFVHTNGATPTPGPAPAAADDDRAILTAAAEVVAQVMAEPLAIAVEMVLLDHTAPSVEIDPNVQELAHRILAVASQGQQPSGERHITPSTTSTHGPCYADLGVEEHVITSGGGEHVATVAVRHEHEHTEAECGHDLYQLASHDNVTMCQYCDEYHGPHRWCAERCDVFYTEVIESVKLAERAGDIPVSADETTTDREDNTP